MSKIYRNIGIMAMGGAVLFVSSCTKNPNSPGVEYMPDMYRSPAVEAYVDYGQVKNVEDPAKTVKLSSKVPPLGTIPYQSDAEMADLMMPYHIDAPKGYGEQQNVWGLAEDPDGETKAALDKIPLAVTDASLKRGKEVYTQFCVHCHGEKGKGDGPVSKKLSGIANLVAKGTSEGLVYYYVTYGKGTMGQHASLINKADRWKLVQYVKALQNGGKYPKDAGLGINMEPDSTGNYTPVVLKDVYFKSGGSAVNERKSAGSMAALLTFMNMNPELNIKVLGHTDNTGSEEINATVSAGRAAAVKAYLVANGVDGARISTEGKGSAEPIASNDTEEGKSMNRRTEIVIVK